MLCLQCMRPLVRVWDLQARRWAPRFRPVLGAGWSGEGVARTGGSRWSWRGLRCRGSTRWPSSLLVLGPSATVSLLQVRCRLPCSSSNLVVGVVAFLLLILRIWFCWTLAVRLVVHGGCRCFVSWLPAAATASSWMGGCCVSGCCDVGGWRRLGFLQGLWVGGSGFWPAGCLLVRWWAGRARALWWLLLGLGQRMGLLVWAVTG